ncbi:MAG TPA: peptide chain release factor N(5)-glutamine methyltransferase [Gemmatimonadales bacterium]
MTAGRQALGMPSQYAVGLAGFRFLDLRCDARALIPRPETEGLVDLALGLRRTGRALDLGTGSGCIALALASEGEYDEVIGVDLSGEALALARENSAVSAVSVRWVKGNWVVPVRDERFDLVVSNPPYIATDELAGLDPSVRDWEPWLALDGGQDGLRATERILRDVPAVLAPAGVLVLELDSRRAGESAALARSRGWIDVSITRDSFGRDRYLTARREPTS